MSDFENGNLDGELLSAYLDDELVPAERAHVEARLATDPAARQLLDELRSVSQSVRDLPKEELIDDLSATVLRRAERAMLTSEALSTNKPPVGGGLLEAVRKLPFGRSRRAWIWAGMTVAAGLLIMVVEKKSDQNADLPGAVASRDTTDVAQGDVQHPMAGLEMRAVGKHTEEAPVADDAADAVAFEVSKERLEKSVPELGAPPATVALQSGVAKSETESVLSTDGFADIGHAGGGGGSLSDAPQQNGPQQEVASEEPPANNLDLLVVHVNAKPEALQGKLFDAVLARNGIVVEDESPSKDDDVAAVPVSPSREVDRAKLLGELDDKSVAANASDSLSARTDAEADGAQQRLDVVLVEAEPRQIASCLSEIDADHTNYLGIAVDDQLTEDKRGGGKSRFNWDQHNRGSVPAEQKVQVDPNNNLYFENNGRQITLGRDVEGYSSVEPRFQEQSEESNRSRAASDDVSQLVQGRALRMQPQNAEPGDGMQTNAPAGGAQAYSIQSPATTEQQVDAYAFRGSNLLRQSVNKLAAKANTVQVLFVLTCPDELQPAAAAPASSPVPTETVP